MKIGLVLPYNITKGGGVKEHVLAQQAELVKRGHDVVIVTPQPREPYIAEACWSKSVSTSCTFMSHGFQC
jgi:hypothetical protein